LGADVEELSAAVYAGLQRATKLSNANDGKLRKFVKTAVARVHKSRKVVLKETNEALVGCAKADRLVSEILVMLCRRVIATYRARESIFETQRIALAAQIKYQQRAMFGANEALAPSPSATVADVAALEERVANLRRVLRAMQQIGSEAASSAADAARQLDGAAKPSARARLHTVLYDEKEEAIVEQAVQFIEQSDALATRIEVLEQANVEARDYSKYLSERLHTALTCPITLEVMKDPVFAADGQTYERSAIKQWLDDNDTSPWTRGALHSKKLTPNLQIKQLYSWIENQKDDKYASQFISQIDSF
jgi:U-box domain